MLPCHVLAWLFAFPQVYELLPLKEIRGYSFEDYYLEEDNVNPCVPLDNVLLNGFVYTPISPDGEGDAYDILKVSASLSIFFVILFFLIYSLLLIYPEGLLMNFAVRLLTFVHQTTAMLGPCICVAHHRHLSTSLNH